MGDQAHDRSVVRWIRPTRALLGAAAIGTIILLIATSGDLWFYYDEWEVIRGRALDIDSLLRPHNEHFSAVLIAIHRGLVDVVGTTSYAPFLAVLWATHLFATATVYTLLREDGSEWQATAGALIFLVPGWGTHNLLTAFQIGFLLATALGCLALALCVRRPAWAAVALTVSVATQGVGLFYLIATGARMVGRRDIFWLVIPLAVYGVWFLGYGLDAMDKHGSGAPASVPAFVFLGIAGAFGQGWPALGVTVIATVALVIRRRAFDRLVIAAAAGLVAMFAVTGLVRAQFGAEQALVSRYFSVAQPFVLVISMAAWRSATERYPVGRLGPVVVAVALAAGLTAFGTLLAAWPGILAADPAR